MKTMSKSTKWMLAVLIAAHILTFLLTNKQTTL